MITIFTKYITNAMIDWKLSFYNYKSITVSKHKKMTRPLSPSGSWALSLSFVFPLIISRSPKLTFVLVWLYGNTEKCFYFINIQCRTLPSWNYKWNRIFAWLRLCYLVDFVNGFTILLSLRNLVSFNSNFPFSFDQRCSNLSGCSDYALSTWSNYS